MLSNLTGSCLTSRAVVARNRQVRSAEALATNNASLLSLHQLEKLDFDIAKVQC